MLVIVPLEKIILIKLHFFQLYCEIEVIWGERGAVNKGQLGLDRGRVGKTEENTEFWNGVKGARMGKKKKKKQSKTRIPTLWNNFNALNDTPFWLCPFFFGI